MLDGQVEGFVVLDLQVVIIDTVDRKIHLCGCGGLFRHFNAG